METYRHIDMQRTGIRLKRLIFEKGYNVKSIQEYLHLSCPQPIYRWYKGQILPSVDNLFMLSKLLGVHMEDILVERQPERKMIIEVNCRCDCINRLLAYTKRLTYRKGDIKQKST